MTEAEEYKAAFFRLFNRQNLETTYCYFDGHSARHKFLRDGWNYAIDQGWLRVETVELEQETFYKGYITDKGRKDILGETI